MQNSGIRPSRFGITEHGICNANTVYWNLGTAQLVEHAIARREGLLAASGPLVVRTGRFTGRSPGDKFIVRDESTDGQVSWGAVNQAISPEHFRALHQEFLASLAGKDLFVQDCFAGADPAYRLPIRVITEIAWHSLFARQLFVRPDPAAAGEHVPEFTLLFAPSFHADPARHGTRSENCIIVDFTNKLVVIGGTSYAGGMKKSIFSILNYLLPERDVFPMHCSANVGAEGDVALFFGLSGTGKTTLSADPQRRLIGDDEHGWSDTGVFNFEGGCYAKCIRLSREQEPQIWQAIRFGTVLENVAVDPGERRLDFNDDSITENTRAAYPVGFIENAVIPGVAGHPSHVVFLAADAFGVLPPISRLTPEQAMYHFLSGYTAKVAGTERGLGKEPSATFSAGFAAPFLPRRPGLYAELLGERLLRHHAECWLVNTGWVGGPYGVGRRMSLPHTRAILHAALSGKLRDVAYRQDPIFGLMAPQSCPEVPSGVLDARSQWSDPAAYDRAAADLAARFRRNVENFPLASEEIRRAGPPG
ncbi:MAG TPA: phosphoenolpyruvate carboxykinase (ATP) [Bryobacterales bacterium]|nr:phosphoenolpyruvate carboxykinase (ATP) [Bryobacterales bacterium]